MTAKEALTKIGALIGKINFSVAPAKFDDGKLSDGTQIQYSALEPGGDISVLDADGNATPAAVGQYELEDGRIITVTEAGKIAEIKDAAPATPDAAAAAATPVPPAGQAMAAGDPAPANPSGVDWQGQIDDLKRGLGYQAERIVSLQNAIQSFSTATKDVLAAQQELMQILASEDKAGAITAPKQTVFSAAKKDKQAGIDRAIAGFKAFADRAKALEAAAAKA